MSTKDLGNWGENFAAKYLENHGYTIVERNYHSRYGEIDIIAKNSKFLIFVEVKLRKNKNYANARDFVTKSKQQKIIKTASIWLSINQTELQARLDVMEIYAPQGEKSKLFEINHIENAFY